MKNWPTAEQQACNPRDADARKRLPDSEPYRPGGERDGQDP
jgi:hypothetical protein